MTARIVLFGATGFTGELVARSLTRQGASPILVGRNASRVGALAGELGGLDTIVADVSSFAAVSNALRRGDVLISTVGPFLRFGQPALEAAVTKGAYYLDSTGEGPFIRQVFDRWGPRAAESGSVLLPAFGFDYVPGNLAASLAMAEAGPDAITLDVGYLWRDFTQSGGTQASIAGMFLGEDGFAFEKGAVRTQRIARRRRKFDVDGSAMTGISAAGSEHLALPAAYPALRDIGVYLSMAPTAARVMSAATWVTAPIRRSARLRALATRAMARFVKGSSGGPSAEVRAKTSVTIIAEARAADGTVLSSVRLEGPDPYDFTGDMLAWGAIRAAESGLSGSGALGPIAAYGLEALQEGCATARLKRV